MKQAALSLAGKVALITGGSRGIGAAAVKMFVAAGAKVAFSYQRARAEAERVIASCGAENCRAVQADLSATGPAEELVAAALAHFGRLDILVANHGIWPPHDVPVDAMSDEQWRRTVGINLDSVFALIKHTVAQLKRELLIERERKG